MENRYGREDLLALAPRVSQPPDGLHRCPYFLERAQVPIVTTPLSELEQVVVEDNIAIVNSEYARKKSASL